MLSRFCADISPLANSVGPKFKVPRSMVYRAIGEHLEAIDNVLEASECFLQMMNELAAETTLLSEQAEWALGKQSCMSLHATL